MRFMRATGNLVFISMLLGFGFLRLCWLCVCWKEEVEGMAVWEEAGGRPRRVVEVDMVGEGR